MCILHPCTTLHIHACVLGVVVCPGGAGTHFHVLTRRIRVAAVPQCEYTFRVQMLEIYNENLRDLLVDGRNVNVNKLDILATQASGCNVPGATQVSILCTPAATTLNNPNVGCRCTNRPGGC